MKNRGLASKYYLDADGKIAGVIAGVLRVNKKKYDPFLSAEEKENQSDFYEEWPDVPSGWVEVSEQDFIAAAPDAPTQAVLNVEQRLKMVVEYLIKKNPPSKAELGAIIEGL